MNRVRHKKYLISHIILLVLITVMFSYNGLVKSYEKKEVEKEDWREVVYSGWYQNHTIDFKENGVIKNYAIEDGVKTSSIPLYSPIKIKVEHVNGRKVVTEIKW